MIDYLIQNLWQTWIVLAVVCLILELTAGDLFIICFSFGAVAAAIFAAFGLNIYYQLAAFSICTLICVFWVRPIAKRYFHKNEENRVSNADALIGRKGKVVEPVIADGYGRVQIDGDIWKAVTEGKEDIPVGATVTVISRSSTIITVQLLNHEQ